MTGWRGQEERASREDGEAAVWLFGSFAIRCCRVEVFLRKRKVSILASRESDQNDVILIEERGRKGKREREKRRGRESEIRSFAGKKIIKSSLISLHTLNERRRKERKDEEDRKLKWQ